MNSYIKTNKADVIFWVIQFFYWGSQSIQWYFNTPYVEGFTFGTWHRANTIVDFLTTILLISCVKLFLKEFLSWGQFKSYDIIKVIMIIFMSALIWTPLHGKTGSILQDLFFSENKYPDELKWESNRIVQVLTISIKMMSSVVSYICIRVFISFNDQRLKTIQLSSSLREGQLSNLKNQINPHFLFNNLNNIRGLMLENPEKSRAMLTRLSEILKYALHTNQFNTISIKEELKIVEYYIGLSKMQLESRLQYSQKVSDEILNYKIPPMIIQLLIENAIKHGVSNIKNGGFVNLYINTNDDEMKIKVSNKGKLSTSKESTGVGLKNITQRLSFIYGNEATLTLKEEEETVVAEIKLPMVG